MRRCLLLLGLGLMMSGCAALAPFSSVLNSPLGGNTPLQVHNQTSVSLASDDFVLVKTNIFGHSTGFSLLGFITLVPPSLSKALDRMYACGELQRDRPQTVAHMIIEHRDVYWILFGLPKIEVHADVVEFRPPAKPVQRPPVPKRASHKPP